MKVGVVLNPAAGGGRMRLEWPFFAAALENRFGGIEVLQTGGPGEAPALACELARRGMDVVVAAGGDGTVSEVADGLLRLPEPRPALAVAPVGTGSDFAKAMGIPRRADAFAAAVAERPLRRIDAGRITYTGADREAATRHFVSIASLGVSGEIVRVINDASAKKRGRMSGKALFFLYTLRELMRYRFQRVRVQVDDQPPIETDIALVAIANNRSFGGGMLIAPMAKMDDGMFEVVIVTGTSRWRLMRDLRLVYSGAHVGLDTCIMLRGRTVAVTPAGDPAVNAAALDVDGEWAGRIPATYEILPLALDVAGAT